MPQLVYLVFFIDDVTDAGSGLDGVFATEDAAYDYIYDQVGTGPGTGTYHGIYRREQFYVEEHEVQA